MFPIASGDAGIEWSGGTAEPNAGGHSGESAPPDRGKRHARPAGAPAECGMLPLGRHDPERPMAEHDDFRMRAGRRIHRRAPRHGSGAPQNRERAVPGALSRLRPRSAPAGGRGTVRRRGPGSR